MPDTPPTAGVPPDAARAAPDAAGGAGQPGSLSVTWGTFLSAYQAGGPPLFGDAFLARWGSEPWRPNDDDRQAAARLHTQIVSRIASQPLGYADGDEKTALTSVYQLFQQTRDIADRFPRCRHFDALAWEVLNVHVRPFTAKWHRRSERGMLAALDATDDFRAELQDLQPRLRRLDDLLVELRDGREAPPAPELDGRGGMEVAELDRGVPWGIPAVAGGLDAATAQMINEAERAAITGRRRSYGGMDPDANHAVGLALSGGGIRSATFSLGVLVALAARGVLPQVDYLSTVSGGGYLGSFLSAFLHSPGDKGIGLRADEFPFRREEGEAAALRHIRHHSKYLAVGTPWRRLAMAAAQLYGMVLNGLAVVYLAVVAVALELLLRRVLPFDQVLRALTLVAAAALGAGALATLAALRFRRRLLPQADLVVAILAAVLVVVLALRGLAPVHAWFDQLDERVADAGRRWSLGDRKTWLAVLGAIPVVTSALVSALGQRLLRRAGLVLLVLSAVAAPLFFFGIYLAIFQWADSSGTLSVGGIDASRGAVLWGVVALGAVLYFLLLDINLTSPHRHYRDQLARAYLVQAGADPADAASYASAVSLRLSALGGAPHRAPYHLLNCALNVPGSKNPAMQGRLTDFFLFSPRYCGSPLIGYRTTEAWEKADPHLDLATAMAISGAAAAPQMGLATVRRLSFWLVLLNVRLGYWLRKPNGASSRFVGAPGLRYLLKEMRGTMDERLPRLNISDGGHIENLGVYELLRRRCRYIIAVDGEQDPKMTFHALTTLQRLASIDLGVQIDLDLDDLRLNEQGLSRSHFRFARIRYPEDGRGSEDLFGYLLYVKLSLTGNEGEFIRRYRLDEPAFPHHSTADQLFSEAQFEAYRSLGEHVGDKLFLRAIVGDLADSKNVEVEKWFLRLGKCLLEPLPAGYPAGAG